MPHKQTSNLIHERTNGAYKFTMSAMNPKVGLPFGSTPRLLLSWLATEAVTKKSRELVLGESMSEFMRKSDMVPAGGRWGSITRLKSQTTRLFSSAIMGRKVMILPV